jgi:hypothetical protein
MNLTKLPVLSSDKNLNKGQLCIEGVWHFQSFTTSLYK